MNAIARGELKIDYQKALNQQQWEVVSAPAGPALVIAGAGAGKTRTITYRVAYLIENGVDAARILLLTFTNKAAQEMMHRVATLLEEELSNLWGGTFHSIGNRVLRRHAQRIRHPRDFSIMDREDAKELIRDCISAERIDEKASFPKPEVVANILSQAANRMISVKEMIQKGFEHFDDLTPQLEAIGRKYVAQKRIAGLMDFDDLLLLWWQLLKDHKATRQMYQERFEHILVDEYQDTNKLQSEIIDLLGARHGNVMVVGDDSQSIYSWRGADFTNLFEFPKRYEQAQTFRIETNYRSTPEILNLANAAISANTRQFKKEMRAIREGGSLPNLITCKDASQQAAFVVGQTIQLLEEGIAPKEVVILYRAHFHAMELQMELTKRRIPFVITSGIRFFEQAHIKDVAAYLRLIVNARDELAFKRLARMLPGIGARTADKLWKTFLTYLPSSRRMKSLKNEGDALQRRVQVADHLARCAVRVPKKSKVAWAELATTLMQLESLERASPRSSLAEMINLILDEGYEDYLKTQFPNAHSRLEDLHQVAQYSLQFQNAEEFLAQLALETNLEVEDRAVIDEEKRIRLSSIHQAKGLEFSVVFVIMLCEGMFPSARSLENSEMEEEERRLFYVAVTRARDQLYLTYPIFRFAQHRYMNVPQQPSRFLIELPEGICEMWNLSESGPF